MFGFISNVCYNNSSFTLKEKFMILKRIEMMGFKSFADRTVIDFSDGFSAIVGPNGCGKSNVADAIRWVLGEQKVRDLRAENMQDVIFNGSEKRRSLSYCEVSLHFDNSNRFFNFNYDELIVTRKLYRSGESEYLLNKNTCRLMDINNILYNSGLGKNGYSIIGQGKITEIVEAKPENRRAMFEDAAGISKYKKDKTDAENKLARTKQNLDRVGDILQEIERQMGPLKKQSEDAKKYLELRNQLKDLEINAYIFQFENASFSKEKINQKLESINEEFNLRQAEFNEISQKYEKELKNSENFDKQLALLNDDILKFTVELEKQEGETKLVREKINYLTKENDRINLDISNTEALLESAIIQKQEKENQSKEVKSRLSELESSFDELSSEYSAKSATLSASLNKDNAEQQRFFESLGAISSSKNNIAKFQAEKGLLANRFNVLENVVKEQTSKQIDLKNLISKSTLIKEEKEAKVNSLSKEIENEQIKLQVKENAHRESQENLSNNLTQIKVFESRKKLLSEMEADYEGYSFSVKKLLKEGEKNSVIKGKMLGVLASLISVPQKFETAVEVALGSALQNIVTQNEAQAKELIEYLKQNSFGRATFLPISSMKTRLFDVNKINKSSGFLGIASDLINYSSQISNVISSLLGSTVFCDNLSSAINLAKNNNYSFKIVTLEGDVINPQGSLTGGSKKFEKVNLINRQREIDDLEKLVKNLEIKSQTIEDSLKNLSNEVFCGRKLINELNERKNRLIIEISTEITNLDNQKTLVSEVEDDLKINILEKNTVENKLIYLSAELDKHDEADRVNIDSGFEKILKSQQEKQTLLRQDLENINTNLTTVKVEMASCKVILQSSVNEIERIEIEGIKLTERVERMKLDLSQNLDFIVSCESIIQQKISKSTNLEVKNKLDELVLSKNQIESRKVDILASIKSLNEEKDLLMFQINKVNDKKFREEMNLAKVDSDIEIMQERIFEEYTLTYDECCEFRRPDFEIKPSMIEINRIKKAINALGSVNVNAIEDCKAIGERYDDLKIQSDDLLTAEEDLNNIIKDLSSIMIEKFMNEIEKINESFKITFRELFGGGLAKLELCDPSRPLESGVEVFVQPPGKKIQNMSLYSGGEKSLTAMAIIFAILRIKPLPFCLFDEVEAALDDSNVEIVDRYLKKLSHETQFILITHKKPTMEFADALFGVTMEEKGVSKIVSVKLAEAIKNAEEESA